MTLIRSTPRPAMESVGSDHLGEGSIRRAMGRNITVNGLINAPKNDEQALEEEGSE